MSPSPAAISPAAVGLQEPAHDPKLYDVDQVAAQATQAQSEEIPGGQMELDVPQLQEQNSPPNHGPTEAVARGDDPTTETSDSTPIAAGDLNGSIEAGKVEPATTSTVAPALSRETVPIPIPPSTGVETLPNISLQPVETASTDAPPRHKSNSSTGRERRVAGTMFGSNPAASHRRRVMATTNALTKYEADLTDQDRAKQKEAVRRYLAERVKTDWEWAWPAPEIPDTTQPGSPLADTGDAAADDPEPPEELWKERDDWPSGASEGESSAPPAAGSGLRRDSQSPRQDQFGSPEGISNAIRKTERDRKRRHKKRLAEEMEWNDGLRCFLQRRDAWTGARHVTAADAELARTRSKQSSTYIPPPSADDDEDADSEWDWTIEVPLAGPILPPENAMRASITPAAYNTIYDKVVLQQLTPSCPMNLKDVTRSCVQGWKRDGEWPPKSVEVPTKKKGRRMSIVSLFSLDKGEAKEKDRPQPEPVAEHSGEKGSKGPGSLGKGIRKMLFWKDKDHGPVLCGAKDGEARAFSPARAGN